MKILKIITALTFLISIFALNTQAQDNILYNMRHIPQYSKDNVARQPDCNFYFGIPVVSSHYVSVANTGFTFNELISPDPNHDGQYMFDLDELEQALRENNYLRATAESAILEFGFRLPQESYFYFGINNKTEFGFQYPRGVVEARDGNYREDGTPLDFTFGLQALNYTETTFGYSKSFYNNMTVGLRVKLLAGSFNLDAGNIGAQWYTDTEGIYDYTFITDMNIRTASIAGGADASQLNLGDTAIFNDFIDEYSDNLDDFSDDLSQYSDDGTYGEYVKMMLFSGNPGLGIDLGFDYQINKKWNISLSVNDIGYIKWKTNPIQMEQSGEFEISGIDIAKYLDNYDAVTGDRLDFSDNFSDDMVDSLVNFISSGTYTNEEYKTSLTSKIYAGAQYSPAKWVDFGFLYKAVLYDDDVLSSATLSANTHILKAWEFSLSYTAVDGQYNNIGLGLASRLGPLQFYILSDNIAPEYWLLNDSDTAEEWIRNTKRTSLHFGLNFTICGGKTDNPLLD